MKNLSFLLIFTLLVVGRINGRSIKYKSDEKNVKRTIRGIADWTNIIWSKPTSTPATTTTIKPLLRENIVECKNKPEFKKDKIIYIEDIIVENSNNETQLGGSVEIHIDSPYTISCVEIFDDTPNGNGADLELKEGGKDQKFISIQVQGKKGYGINMRVVVRGKEIESEMNELKVVIDDVREKMKEATARVAKEKH